MAVSLKKTPHEDSDKTDLSDTSMPVGLREYTPIHLINEEETIQSHPAQQDPGKDSGSRTPNILGSLPESAPTHLRAENEAEQPRPSQQDPDDHESEKTSNSLLVFVIVLAIVIVWLIVAVVVLLDSRGERDNSEPANVGETSNISKPVQSSTTANSEWIPQSTVFESDTPPAYGSMSSVMILGVEYDIASTTELDLTGNDITDEVLKQIVRLTNLTELRLGCNQISDIVPLSGLTNLTILGLEFNQVSDTAPLSGLTNLTWLDLEGNKIKDVTPLAGITNLKSLNLSMNRISDITPLSGLTYLTALKLSYNQISDITSLTGMTHLTRLSLFNNQISDTDKERLKAKLPNCDIFL